MNPQIAMILRYVFAMLVTTAVQRGWLHVADVDGFVQQAVDFVGQVVAFAPAIWALFKVNNTPIAKAS